MPLFLEPQMENTPNCYIINSEDDWTDTESTTSTDGNKISSSLKDSCKDILDTDIPTSVNGNGSPNSTNIIQDLSKDDTDSSLNPLIYIQDDEGESSREPGMDDFEFDFQTIDEAEQTEHILKVRVHANFCMRCGTGFVQQKKLNLHLEKNDCSANNTSTEMPLTCSICGQSFFGIKCLRHHFMCHAQTKPFKCKKCSISFVTQRDLYSHYRSHNGYRPFICDLCPKTFDSSKNLVQHKRQSHVGERPFACRLCPKRFNKSKNLANHKRKHASKKPFKCKFCRRSYAQNSVRNMHMRTHTISKSGLLKFLCEVCGLTHVRSRSIWVRIFPATERRRSNDSVAFLEGYETDTSKGKKRRRKSSESSDSVQIIEDPLQFTIDLLDD